MADSPTISLWAATVPALLALASGVATALITNRTTIRTEIMRGNQAYEREQQARLAATRDAQLQRRNEAQHELLLQLQDVAHAMVRQTAQVHLADTRASKKGVPWRRQFLPEDLNQSIFATNTQMTKLAVRVRDEGIRTCLQKFRQECDRVVNTEDEAATEKLMMQASVTYDGLNKRIGDVIRKLEDPQITA